MYCTNCGSQNVDKSKFCKDCGKAMPGSTPASSGDMGGSAPPPHIPNYLVQAILVTVFCCLPLGIVSIVYAAQVNRKVAVGNIDGARSSAKRAKTWAWVAFGLGFAIYVSVILIAILASQTDSSSTSSAPSTLTFSEARSKAQTISYDELFRNNEQYETQLFYFEGEIVQVIEHFLGDGYAFV